jgi:hypothetical protein
MRESGFRAPSLTWFFGPPDYSLSVVMYIAGLTGEIDTRLLKTAND